MQTRIAESHVPRPVERRRQCQAPGCKATTRGAKPYCIRHVELNPYAQKVTELMQAAS